LNSDPDQYLNNLKGFISVKSKAEVPEIIVEFIKYLNNQFEEYNIKIFKLDGGKEFKNKTVNKYFK